MRCIGPGPPHLWTWSTARLSEIRHFGPFLQDLSWRGERNPAKSGKNEGTGSSQDFFSNPGCGKEQKKSLFLRLGKINRLLYGRKSVQIPERQPGCTLERPGAHCVDDVLCVYVRGRDVPSEIPCGKLPRMVKRHVRHIRRVRIHSQRVRFPHPCRYYPGQDGNPFHGSSQRKPYGDRRGYKICGHI